MPSCASQLVWVSVCELDQAIPPQRFSLDWFFGTWEGLFFFNGLFSVALFLEYLRLWWVLIKTRKNVRDGSEVVTATAYSKDQPKQVHVTFNSYQSIGNHSSSNSEVESEDTAEVVVEDVTDV